MHLLEFKKMKRWLTFSFHWETKKNTNKLTFKPNEYLIKNLLEQIAQYNNYCDFFFYFHQLYESSVEVHGFPVLKALLFESF